LRCARTARERSRRRYPGAVISTGILDEATQESGYARIEVPGPATK
jgi:hypothetical protein